MKTRRRLPRHSEKKGDTAQLAAELAPLEELDREAARKQEPEGANQEHGAIVVDNRNMQLPKGVDEAGEGKRELRIEPVVIVIAALMLLYVAFIAWQVSEMPAP